MSQCAVSGILVDSGGNLLNGATVRFNLVSPAVDNSNNIVMPCEVNVVTGSSGAFTLSIDQGLSGIISIDYPPNSTDATRRATYSVIIPSQSTANFYSLINPET